MPPKFTNIRKPKVVLNLLAIKAQSKCQQAIALHQKGQLSQAQALYEEILIMHPKHFGSLHLLGVISHQTKNLHRAVDLIGKPTWVLLPFLPDWRWLLDRADSPWYPSAKLYRQETIGDWDSVFERVKADLSHLSSN